jgi:hypothetical protein
MAKSVKNAVVFRCDHLLHLSVSVGEGFDGPREDYWCEEFDSPMGRAFSVRKFGNEDGESYSVLLANEQDTSCSCPAGIYRGLCKHLDALRTWVEVGEPDGKVFTVRSRRMTCVAGR